MTRSFSPRFDIFASVLAAVCLIGPMLMGLAASISTTV
jgi:hypothetical protein